jgi:hypothetical protein
VGDTYPAADVVPRGYKAVYGFGLGIPGEEAETDRQLAEKGLKRVTTVSNKRLVFFLPSEPANTGKEQLLARRHEYSTVWLEGGQAFAIQQFNNPGPAEMRPLNMTETELKQAVADLRAVDATLGTIVTEPDRAKRGRALVALLKPGAILTNEEVKAQIRSCGRAAWPAIESALVDGEQIAIHAELIYLAHHLAREDAHATFQKIVADERAYFENLDSSGKKYDRKKPPHVHHEHRRSAAKWALDSLRLNP